MPLEHERGSQPFDRRTELPRGPTICTYDLDVRDVHDSATAEALLATLNARVQAGRALVPEGSHYVNVIGRASGTRPKLDFEALCAGADLPPPDDLELPAIDDEVRAVLFPDGIVGADSVALIRVEGERGVSDTARKSRVPT